MNILKRITPVILSLLFVFSAGVSSIAHAADDITGKNVISITTYNGTKNNVYEKTDGNKWENTNGDIFRLTRRTTKWVYLKRIYHASSAEDWEGKIFMFNIKNKEIHTIDADGSNEVHIEWSSIVDMEGW